MRSDRGILTWPWPQVQELLRVYGPEIGALARKGDKLARQVLRSYQYAYEHPNDVEANRSLRAAIDDYLQRDLRVDGKRELASRYDHNIESIDKH